MGLAARAASLLQMNTLITQTLRAGCLLACGAAHASDLFVGELPTIVVTPSSADGSAFTVPHSLSVITASDIDNSSSTNLGELLSREAGLNLKSFFGGDKNAAVDIRGMGDTAVSNVLILVDGVRLNEADLSGADLSSLALTNIRRVEIVRGGGAVRYGDGAVGGVINILTRRPVSGALNGSVEAQLVTYDGRTLRASATGGSGELSARLAAGRSTSNGYRDNSEFNRSDGSFELRYLPDGAQGAVDAYVRVSVHQDQYGLPGPVSAAAFAGSEAERRSTRAPFDGGRTDDRMVTLGTHFDWGTYGELELLANWRDRDNPYLIGYSAAIPEADQANRIESQKQEWQARYRLDVEASGHKHSFGLGMHWQTADYTRHENGEAVLGNSARRVGELEGMGGYAEATLRGSNGLALNLGARVNRLASDFRDEKYTQECVTYFPPTGCVDAFRPQGASRNTWRNQAYELGLTWQTRPEQMFFVSASQHFRAPNVDELALATTDLRPQTGVTAELGMRLKYDTRVEFSATVFGMRNEDEIYFGQDPSSGSSLNRNYEQATRRLGLELQGRWRFSPAWMLVANGGYVQPRFSDIDADIPHVPRVTANARVEWTASEAWLLSANVRYVGQRYDGNDQTNRDFPILPAYSVYDLSTRYRFGDFDLTAAVLNLFDEVYSTVAYSATYYPMPGRTFTAGVRWHF